MESKQDRKEDRKRLWVSRETRRDALEVAMRGKDSSMGVLELERFGCEIAEVVTGNEHVQGVTMGKSCQS